MKAASALARLRDLGKPVVTTDDAVLALRLTCSAATQTLKRLAADGLLRKIRHGLWAVDQKLDPLALPEFLTAPFPAYVSFQSALYLHGMVSQVPEVIYVASLARTRRVGTSLGTFSVHRLAPTFFGGFETRAQSGIRLATPEKALLDALYLGPSRSRIFAQLPEIEIPPDFDVREGRRWLARIPPGPRRLSVERRLERYFATAVIRPSREGRPSRPSASRAATRQR